MKQAATTQQRTNCNNATPVHTGHCQDNDHRSQRITEITTHVADPRRHERRQCDSSAHTQPATTPQHMQRQHMKAKVSPDRSGAQTECSQLQIQHSADPCLTPKQGRAMQRHHTSKKVSPDRSDAKTDIHSCKFNTPPTPVLHQAGTRNRSSGRRGATIYHWNDQKRHIPTRLSPIPAVRKDTQQL